mmetsp:Transcript_11567/g.44893  ORF Transcript_11567/g.44893 Transcript_11567/m.44893 type:complete len:343 (-) Transcript_11567:1330-2358(-)
MPPSWRSCRLSAPTTACTLPTPAPWRLSSFRSSSSTLTPCAAAPPPSPPPRRTSTRCAASTTPTRQPETAPLVPSRPSPWPAPPASSRRTSFSPAPSPLAAASSATSWPATPPSACPGTPGRRTAPCPLPPLPPSRPHRRPPRPPPLPSGRASRSAPRSALASAASSSDPSPPSSSCGAAAPRSAAVPRPWTPQPCSSEKPSPTRGSQPPLPAPPRLRLPLRVRTHRHSLCSHPGAWAESGLSQQASSRARTEGLQSRGVHMALCLHSACARRHGRMANLTTPLQAPGCSTQANTHSLHTQASHPPLRKQDAGRGRRAGSVHLPCGGGRAAPRTLGAQAGAR